MDSESRNYPPGRSAPRHQGQACLAVDSPENFPPHAQDHWRVNLAEAWEITLWSREFRCTEAQLKEAVQAVGDSAGAVRSRLSNQDQQRSN